MNKTTKLLFLGLATGTLGLLGSASSTLAATYTYGGVDFGNTLDYLFVFTDGSKDANWQGASKGFVGDIAINGKTADERTSGKFGYSGTIYTNDSTLDSWQDIVDHNSVGGAYASNNASAVFDQESLIDQLTSDVDNVFSQIDGLTATSGYESFDAADLDGLDFKNGVADNIVINITDGLSISEQLRVSGDADDFFFLRWDDDANASNGYDGQVKFKSGGGIVPIGDLTAANFFHTAGDIKASGGGSTPTENGFAQGARSDSGAGDLCEGCEDFDGGGFFTGYWFTTGDEKGETSSMSNAIFNGGWYSTTTKFDMTSGTSGVHIAPMRFVTDEPETPVDIPEPTAVFGLAAFGAIAARLKRQRG
ncbi:MAG: hypothetical protein AAFP20_21855 [Cyanobacteria bacterium J06614_10]